MTLADVYVEPSADLDALRELLRRNPHAELAVGVGGGSLVVVTRAGGVITCPSTVAAACLTADDVLRSAIEALYAWSVAGLDLALLRRNGVPVWCTRHHDQRSAVPCGRLHPAQPG
ncbi:MAG: hypothetical protein HOY78_36845 [Saccharothrix sp.]|nr:hypothetical protein [Saccharothrix sp.]